MFTGIVQEVGEIQDRKPFDQGFRLVIRAPKTAPALDIGDSVSTNGVCLTCVEKYDDAFAVDVGAETLRRTTLGRIAVGTYVNLEPAMRLSDRLGGHLVAGHVDGTGKLVDKMPEGEGALYTFWAPQAILKYAIEKGSIAVDGVSLTLFHVTQMTFQVALIPHTLQATTLSRLAAGDEVNLEADMIAKYVERLMPQALGPRAEGGGAQ